MRRILAAHGKATLFLGLVCLATLPSCLGFKSDGGDQGGVARVEFAGLEKPEYCRLGPNRDQIFLTWAPAKIASNNRKNANSPVSYEIYEGIPASFLASTTETSFKLDVDPKLNKNYTFIVKARDGYGLDINEKTCQVAVSYDGIPPVFSGAEAAWQVNHQRIQIAWSHSPSPDLKKYNIYFAQNLNNPIGFTTKNYFMVKDLVPNTNYKFVVRAEDASGNEDTNKVEVSANTSFEDLPNDFDGAIDAVNLSGVAGLSQLRLRWLASKDPTVTGYLIYRAAVNDNLLPFGSLFTQIAPPGSSTSANAGAYIPRQTGGVDNTSVVVNGLNSGQTYFFVVRAFRDGSPVKMETNRVVAVGTTNTEKAPSFLGVENALPSAGDAGWTAFDAFWSSASANGVHDKYRIRYKSFGAFGSRAECNAAINCSTADMTGATIVDTGSETDVSWQVGALTPQHCYCVQVNTLYSVSDLEDTNTRRARVFTEPEPPQDVGILTANRRSGEAGWTSVDVTWGKTLGSFSRYVVQVDTDSNFGSPDQSINITNRDQLTTTISGLSPKTDYWFRVKSEYEYTGTPTVTLTGTKHTTKLMVRTEPPAALDEFITVTVASPDSVTVKFNPPTNSGALYDHWKLWRTVGGTAETDIVNFRSLVPFASYAPGAVTEPVLITGLTSGTKYCFQARADYDPDGDGSDAGQPYLLSKSTKNYACAIPKLNPPSAEGVCAGNFTVSNPNNNTGFTRLVVNWTPRPDGNNFTWYRILWRMGTDPTWDDTTGTGTYDGFFDQTDFTVGTHTISSLNPHKTYFVKVLCQNNPATVYASTPESVSAVQSAKTTPLAPSGSTQALTAEGSTAVRLSITAATQGLWNNVFVYVATDATEIDNTLFQRGTINSNNDRVPASGDFDAMMGTSGTPGVAGEVTLSALPAIIRIDQSLIAANPATNDFLIKGLTPNVTHYVRTRAAYWLDSDIERYVQQASPQQSSAKPVAGPPGFAGIDGFSKFGNSDDFTKVRPTWGTITGDCDEMWIYVRTNTTKPNPAVDPADKVVTGCASDSSTEYSGLTHLQTYYVTVVAVNIEGASKYFAGDDQQLSIFTKPDDYNPPPGFTGIASAAVDGTCSDGSARLRLELNGGTFDAGSVSPYSIWEIYWSPQSAVGSFNFASPWQTITYGDASLNPAANGYKRLYAGCVDKTFGGPNNYFVVRWKYQGAPGALADTNTAVSNSVNVPNSQSHYAYISKAVSGLGYDYYIMTYEASLATGSSFAGDSVAVDEANMLTCSHEFHVNQNPRHSSCGLHLSNVTVRSKKNVAPVTGATFAQAFWACRNSTSLGLSRLPTREEWLRASRWVATTDYSTMWTVYSNGGASNCRISGGSGNTGDRSSCLSGPGVYDLAGNVSEWVDERLFRVTPTARFGYVPALGRILPNGISRQTDDATAKAGRRYHLIDPGAGALALVLGADSQTPNPSGLKQYGPDVQRWVPPTATETSIGFRCVLFHPSDVPTMSELALPEEPVYAGGDTIPENLYEKDTRPETLRIVVNGNTGDDTPEGEVQISWKPWSRTVCNPGCTTSDANLTYKLYRFTEPTVMSRRTTAPWALAGGPYAADKDLDPLALASATGTPLHTPIKTINDCSSGTEANCAFTDSTGAGTGFNPGRLYNYILVVADQEGNHVAAQVQTFRSPYFTGDFAPGAAATFRMEPRYRRAGVFLVDEAHQQAQIEKQIMVHVPLDQSGLDHDFFIQKYEGYVTGTVDNDSGDANFPLAATDGTNDWVENAAACHDSFLRTGNTTAAACGTNATSAIVQSGQNVAPSVNITQGAFWKACRNSPVRDVDNNIYRLMLASNAEWSKAADWGDLDHDGDIDQHVNLGTLPTTDIATLEFSGDPSTYCNSSTMSPLNTANGTTTHCHSRYGAADMVGNIWEWVSDRMFNSTGYDNGTDGLWLDHGLKGSDNHSGVIDLWRGTVPGSGSGSTVATNGDSYLRQTGLTAAFRGGAWVFSGSSGRWFLSASFAPSYQDGSIGGRCVR